MEAWKRLTGLFAEALWPRKALCLCCGRPSRGNFLCAACRADLEDHLTERLRHRRHPCPSEE